MDLIEQKMLADILIVACGVMCMVGAVIDKNRKNRTGFLWDLGMGFFFFIMGILFFFIHLIRY